jgi:predicted nucleotidyltransferase
VDFRAAFVKIAGALRRASIDFALIGGFALAALKVPRATGDLDFLADGKRADDVDRVMQQLGYEVLHRSHDAANFASRNVRLGRVDFLFAHRAYTKGMLARAVVHRVFGRHQVKVVEPEDLIGLKVQSSTNNPGRMRLDMNDIARLLDAHPALDLDRVREYFRLFDREAEIEALLAERQRGRT